MRSYFVSGDWKGGRFMATKHPASVEERSVGDLKTRTFTDERGNVEFIFLSHGKVKVGLIPKTEIARQNGLGEDTYHCLKRCSTIKDDHERIQCIVLCPANKAFDVMVSAEFTE
jgi:hypothetical protein